MEPSDVLVVFRKGIKQEVALWSHKGAGKEAVVCVDVEGDGLLQLAGGERDAGVDAAAVVLGNITLVVEEG